MKAGKKWLKEMVGLYDEIDKARARLASGPKSVKVAKDRCASLDTMNMIKKLIDKGLICPRKVQALAIHSLHYGHGMKKPHIADLLGLSLHAVGTTIGWHKHSHDWNPPAP